MINFKKWELIISATILKMESGKGKTYYRMSKQLSKIVDVIAQ